MFEVSALFYPPLEGGSKRGTRFGEGLAPGTWGEPLPEKCFAFFDPPARGG
jgi:hypothetical protein